MFVGQMAWTISSGLQSSVFSLVADVVAMLNVGVNIKLNAHEILTGTPINDYPCTNWTRPFLRDVRNGKRYAFCRSYHTLGRYESSWKPAVFRRYLPRIECKGENEH